MAAQIQSSETWLSRYLQDRYGDAFKSRFRKQRLRNVTDEELTRARQPWRDTNEPRPTRHPLFNSPDDVDWSGPEFQFDDLN